MLATFPHCNFPLGFPEKLSQTLICYHYLSVSGNSDIMRCGMHINMPYFKISTVNQPTYEYLRGLHPSRPLVVCHKLNKTIVILNTVFFIFIIFSVRLKVHVVSRTVSLAVIVHVKLRRNVLRLLYVRVIRHSVRLVLINLTLAAVTTTHSTAGTG